MELHGISVADKPFLFFGFGGSADRSLFLGSEADRLSVTVAEDMSLQIRAVHGHIGVTEPGEDLLMGMPVGIASPCGNDPIFRGDFSKPPIA